jgi:hypothetical protein
MALIGDGFIDYVKKQIDTRQSALGEYDIRQLKNTKAFMTRTPWVRMVSSVDLTEGNTEFPGKPVLNVIKDSGNYAGIDLSGDNLAKNFILFNGISNQKGGITNLYSGINGGYFGGAYGFGSKDDIQNERGFVPMPGITNVTFQYKNDGALATATVQIKAFSRSQFQLIDVLFQRPGYTVLLEFGSTVYLNNNGDLVEASYDTEPFRHMFKPDQDMFILHNVIAKEKKKWEGNYEGFFAKIAKWNWKFNTDGSYDITVSLVGMGDVIDSLKVNVAIDKKSAATIKGETSIFSDEVTNEDISIVATAKLSRLNYALYNIYKNIKEKGGSIVFNKQWNVNVSNFISYIKNQDGLVENINPPSTLKISRGAISIPQTQNSEPNAYSPQTYITFGTLLALITSTLSISSKNNTKTTPYILFDFNFDDLSKDDNYIATFPGNFSSNPNICLIPYEPISPEITNNVKLPDSDINKFLKSPNNFSVTGNSLIGRMAYIYLDVNFIAKTFKSSLNENNEVILIEFLKNILNEVNNSLGGLNNFRIIHNKDTNLFEIRSEVPLNVKPTPEPSTINTFGVTRGEGSFVREMDLNSELTDKYATQISVGAQADGNISQANSTSFSIYNKGLVDRIIKKTVDTSKSTLEIISDPFPDLFTEDIITGFGDMYNEKQFTDPNIGVLNNINSEFCKLATGVLTQRKKYTAPFFLPFNLGLTMDGLSGMKIYQSFKVDGKALPLTYNSDDIQLIIKSLSHDVSPNGWLTKVETIAGPIIPPITSLMSGTYSESGQVEVAPQSNIDFNALESTTPGVDPAPIINPGKIGANSYSFSPVAKSQIANGGKNGELLLKPPYLVPMPHVPGKYLHPSAAKAWELWRNEMIRLGITKFRISSAYRNRQQQQNLSGRAAAAPAGSSPHGWGGAIDFGNLYQLVGGSPDPKKNLEARKKYEIYKQIAAVGAKYGWYNPWRLSDIMGKQDEIWHFEYWGLV